MKVLLYCIVHWQVKEYVHIIKLIALIDLTNIQLLREQSESSWAGRRLHY